MQDEYANEQKVATNDPPVQATYCMKGWIDTTLQRFPSYCVEIANTTISYCDQPPELCKQCNNYTIIQVPVIVTPTMTIISQPGTARHIVSGKLKRC